MKYRINLLPQKETPLTEKIVYFALNYLRYIIVITQLVVIAVFFYRFQIDQKIIDLKESVDQKKEILQIVLPLLNQANNIDKKTMAVKDIFIKQQTFQEMLKYLLSIFPSAINLTDFEASVDSLKLTGVSTDSHQLQSFYFLLKKDNKFDNVNLDSIKKIENGYSFKINLNGFNKDK